MKLLLLSLVVSFGQIQSKCSMIDSDKHRSAVGKDIKVNNRIIDGTIARQYRPFMVSIFKANQFIGGGVIIGQNWILTAAHLFRLESVEIGKYRVGIGSNNIYKQKLIAISKIHQHTNFQRSSLKADIALVETREPLLYKDRTDFIYLPYPIDRNPIRPNQLILIGWGDVQYKLKNPDGTLNEAEMRLVERYACAIRYSNPIDETNVCAISKNDSIKSRTCQGDSGGPLYEIIEKEPILVGIASWTANKCLPNYPNVFTKVSAYLEWICHIVTNDTK